MKIISWSLPFSAISSGPFSLISNAETHTLSSHIILWHGFALSSLVLEQQPWEARAERTWEGRGLGRDRSCSPAGSRKVSLPQDIPSSMETYPKHINTIIYSLFLKLFSGGKHFTLLRGFFFFFPLPRPSSIMAHKSLPYNYSNLTGTSQFPQALKWFYFLYLLHFLKSNWNESVSALASNLPSILLEGD